MPLEPGDMGGDRGPGTADLIVYIDRSDIREGRFEDLKDGIRRLVEVIESREPSSLRTASTSTKKPLELHLDIGRTEFRRLADMITLRQIEVYGALSDKAHAMLEQKAKMLGGGGVTVHERFAGFARPPTARD